MFDLLFKHSCIFCGELSDRDIDLCLGCEQDLPFLKNYCKRCASLIPFPQTACGDCLEKLSIDINTTVLLCYEPPIDKLIMNLKFQNNLIGGKILGELMASHLVRRYKNEDRPEVIIPVPLHSVRLKERGYNQALELAKPIAKKLKMPIDKCSIIKKRNSEPQARLPAKERGKNIKNAFHVSNNLKYEHVAIVDDVITTGSTVFELCRILSDKGVKKIDIWCVAKSVFRRRC